MLYSCILCIRSLSCRICLIDVIFDLRKQDLRVHDCVSAPSGCSCVFVCLPPACLHTASALLILSSAVRPGCRLSESRARGRHWWKSAFFKTHAERNSSHIHQHGRSVIVQCVLTFLLRTCTVFQCFCLNQIII